MRLGQLARKLSLRPSQLVDFLAEQNITTEEGSNTRISDEHTELIVRHFAPESLEEIMKPAVEEIVSVEVEIPVEEPLPAASELEVKIGEPVAAAEESTEQQSEPEVIRVQKIELSGLKVLGKIDLPEPRKKEPKVEGEGSSTEGKTERKGRGQRGKQSGTEKDQRTWRNPLEAQRKREARELEEKRRAELEREKERKKNHYESKVKQQAQRPKKVKATKTIAVKKPADTRPVPKTWLGKFFRWWTT